ncbi:unnamed protein product [Rotaria socialis]|uniref:G-protein coupled receptors family 1 profile domain-containing protein n=1 Tax=Rotaria socialis TaxID=392032 RepID=A0A820W7P8_9BILA|nr:unnamed protein product [Rotaria socialis]CAF3483271.1 unnamed protein product [Rotaria socialis]CAF4319679.1 unnamed protein product [Rotaria socialis]CAF4513705.1 unnamed protein product [Rotaria socialis]
MPNAATNTSIIDHIVLDGSILTLYSLTFVIGVIGNLLVLKVIFYQRKKCSGRSKTITSTYLAHLALTDLLSATTIPLQFLFCSYYLLENFKICSFLCVIFKSIQILSYNVSILTMVVIAIDRYLLIHYPLQSSNKRFEPKYSLLVVWLLALLYAISCLRCMKVSEYFQSSQELIGCRILFDTLLPHTSFLFRKIRVTIAAVYFYFIPLLITAFLYILCVRTISGRPSVGNSSKTLFSESKKRTMKMLIILLLVFAICWLPIQIMNLKDFYLPSRKSMFHPLNKRKCNASTTYCIFYWIAISSCCYNPFIYSWLNKNFRRSLRVPCCSKYDQKPRCGSNVNQASNVFYSTNFQKLFSTKATISTAILISYE